MPSRPPTPRLTRPKAALAAATLAESSAAKTASAAKAVVLADDSGLARMRMQGLAMADVDEGLAHVKYTDAVDKQKARSSGA